MPKKKLSKYKKLIPGCFSDADKIFADHRININRAKEMLGKALKEELSWGEFEKAIREYLEKVPCLDKHIDEQIERIKDLSNYFPAD